MVLAFAALAAVSLAEEDGPNPISKVLEMLSDLQAKIIKEGEVAQKEYAAYAEWCEDKSKDLHYEIKTEQAQVDELKATIAKEDATMDALTARIDELAAKLADDQANLKAATEIRDHETVAFGKEEAELVEVLSALERAIAILTRELAKSGASMLQLTGASDIIQALSTLVQASMLSSADAGKLTALVQSSSQSDETDEEFGVGAPDAAVYKGHEGGIIETLEGLREKAQKKLDDARKTETANLYNFELLRQSLQDAISVASGELEEAKNGMAGSKERKGVATGDLDVTSKDLAADVAALADTHQSCMTTAEDFEAATRSRDEELRALAEAKKVLKEKTGGAEELSYGLNQMSLLQVTSRTDQPHAVVRFMLDLARRQNSKSLAQLASRISSTIRLSSAAGQDPFAKVQGLISDLIARLEKEGSADAAHKAYCDKELQETNVKKDEKA